MPCQQCSRSSLKKAPMIPRPVLSEPYRQVAFDLVGPLPKAKGGCQFILTCICMATRWPEAVAHRSITAKAVAEAMIEILCRMGIPEEILTDRGTQFCGRAGEELCKVLGIKHLLTTAYHPQTNGCIERMHGTLESMCTKAAHKGLDWVQQLPLCSLALGQNPHRDSGLSPFEMAYGWNVQTPLEALYSGWVSSREVNLDVSAWVALLQDRLELHRDVAQEGLEEAVKKRKIHKL